MLINAFMLQLAVGWWCDNPCMSSRVSRFICLFWVVNQQCEQRLADTPRRWVTRPRPLDFSEFLFLCQCPSGCKRQPSCGRVFHVFLFSFNQFSTMELVWEFVSESLFFPHVLRTFSPSQFHPKIQGSMILPAFHFVRNPGDTRRKGIGPGKLFYRVLRKVPDGWTATFGKSRNHCCR